MYINEPKLSDFKMVLLQEGMQAEFASGVLICNETVAVRRVCLFPYEPCLKKTCFCHMQTTKAQISLRIRVV